MRKVLIFALLAFVCIGVSDAAVRDGNTQTRTTNTAQRTVTNANQSRTATTNTSTTARNGATTVAERTATTQSRAATTRNTTPVTTARTVVNQRTMPATVKAPARSTVARNASDAVSAMSETRIGAEYETCKNAYFTCMDQFCRIKNDDYRRCSCSNRVYEFDSVREVMVDANTKLTQFTEGLDAVGMTSAQATAMRNASEGENALTSDGSASKALLQAIMNSIRGGDTNVGGKYSDLNSINISFDTANAFGLTDAGQAIAAYNGTNLYTAIYNQCRNAVRPDCNDASLQRAVTAYLMAIEQDCNTVQSSLDTTKKNMTAAVREGGAMLDLARVENRQKHNSDDMTACLNNVEAAVLSEEVCGSGYRKCLDNGEFIDISTGKPIAGVVQFYKLKELLTFDEDAGVADKQLSKISNNRTFVLNFEKRVKKFAEPALDKCVEIADDVWADYLDKAMLDIYYAQKSKVSEIEQGCFDFVSACYMNGDTSLTIAMQSLTSDASIALQPDRITLNNAVCTEYVASCDNMFEGIIGKYIENRQDTDTLAACRAVVKQCFDKFGGSGYENFYYPHSGLFGGGEALNWFTLCEEYDADGYCTKHKSECAKQLSNIASCSSDDMMLRAFGGMDWLPYRKGEENNIDEKGKYFYDTTNPDNKKHYGIISNKDTGELDYRAVRSTGVASEIYYQIIDILNTQCNNVQGRFVELQFLKNGMYKNDDICASSFKSTIDSEYYNLATLYGVEDGEDMCPRGYRQTVDTASWGACLCWENGARRSKWGTSAKCMPELPTNDADGSICPSNSNGANPPASTANTKWCTQPSTNIQSTNRISSTNQVCPLATTGVKDGNCYWDDGSAEYQLNVVKIPAGIR